MQRFVESTRRRGFTLMELLVVLAILVLLMAMVAPRVLKFLGKSDISVAKSQIGSLKKSLDLYSADCRSYPTTEQGLQALIYPPAMGETGTAVRGWDGPYLDGDSVPVDPWGLPYGYSFPPTRGRGPGPDIWSFGPDNMDGTEDDICSWTLGPSGTGEQGMMGQDPMGGQLGPNGMPQMDQGFPPMDGGGMQPGGMQPGGMQPGGMQPGGMQPGGMQPGGMQPGGMPPMDQGGMPPLGGGTGPMGGTPGPVPPGSAQPPRNF
jgi:general secretion pathway protein G